MQYLLNVHNVIMKVNGCEICSRTLQDNNCTVFVNAQDCYQELAERLLCKSSDLVASEFQLVGLEQSWYISRNDGVMHEIIGDIVHHIVSLKH